MPLPKEFNNLDNKPLSIILSEATLDVVLLVMLEDVMLGTETIIVGVDFELDARALDK